MEVFKREGFERGDAVFAGEDVEVRVREESGGVVLVWGLVQRRGREVKEVFVDGIFAGEEGFFESFFGGF